MRLDLHLVQKLALQCTVCGNSLVDVPEHASDVKIQARSQLPATEPVETCPKCGQLQLASRINASIKITRQCPRCKRTLYQFARLVVGRAVRKFVRFKCADCGNEWCGRYLSREWA